MNPYLYSPRKEDVLETTRMLWDVDGDVIVPKGEWLRCPICKGQPLIRGWVFFEQTRENVTHPYRCDVKVKCTTCAHVWVHGVAIPEEVYARSESAQRRDVFGRLTVETE